MFYAASLITEEITTLISGIAGDMVPTVLSLIAIIVPVGLSLWAVGFGVKKGIGFLQKKAKTAL